jgi:hypothetical protein
MFTGRVHALTMTAGLCVGAALLSADDRAPAVRIVSVTVDGRTGQPGTAHPPGRGNIEIVYALVEPAEGVRFRYKLEGFDAGWIDAGDRRRVYYTGLPGGRYRFVVETGRNGVWSGATAGTSIHLRPPFYRTRPFYVIAAAAALTLIVAAWALSDRQRR